MNKLSRIIAVLFAFLGLASTAFAQVSISGAPNGAIFFVKSNRQNLLNAENCKSGTATWLMDRFLSRDEFNPEIVATDYTPFPQVSSGPSYTHSIDGVNKTFTIELGMDVGEVQAGYTFKSTKYTLTCRDTTDNSVQVRTITLVASKNDQFKPSTENGYSPKYLACGDPSNVLNLGARIGLSAGITKNNELFYKKPNDASFTSMGVVPFGESYKRLELVNGEVQTGVYSFKFAYFPFYDGVGGLKVDEMSGEVGTFVTAKTGSPISISKVNGSIGGISGLSLIVNNKNPYNGSVTACASDDVTLNWENWDAFRNDPKYANYSFVWSYENNGNYTDFPGKADVNSISLSEFFNIKNLPNAGLNIYNFKLRFIPNGLDAGCPTDVLDNTKFNNDNSNYVNNALTLKVLASGIAMITSEDKGNVCIGGSTKLSLTNLVSTTPAGHEVSWYFNDQLLETTSNPELSLSIDKPGRYSAQYTVDESNGLFRNINNETCKSVLGGYIVENYPLPAQPSIITGKDGAVSFCDYTDVKQTVKAFAPEMFKAWEWSTTATTAGTFLNDEYQAVAFGKYKAKYKNENGCWSNYSEDFSILALDRPAKPTISSSSPSQEHCDYEKVSDILTGSSGSVTATDWKWTAAATIAGSSKDAIYTTSDFGKYNVAFSDKNGCWSLNSDDFVISPLARPAIPTISTSGVKNAYCDYDTVSDILTASSGDVTATKWEWNAIASKVGSSKDAVYTTADFGTYAVKYADGNGCWSLSSDDFVISPLARPGIPTITSNKDFEHCDYETVSDILTASPVVDATDWKWYVVAGKVGSSKDGVYTTADFGTYSVAYADRNGCWSDESAKFKILPLARPSIPTITSSSKFTEYCDYTIVSDVLTASPGNNTANDWKWVSTANKQGTSKAGVYTTADFGTYKASYKNERGCWSFESAEFAIKPIARPAIPTIKLTGNPFNCSKDENGNIISVKFELTSAPLAALDSKYQWYIGNGATPVQNNGTTVLNGIISNSTVTLTQTDGKTGCVSLVSSPAVVNFQANPSFVNGTITKSAYTLVAKGFDDANALDYKWMVGSSILGVASTQKVQNGSGEYSVARFVKYTNGSNTISCLSSAIKYAYVPDPEFSGVIVFPNPASTSVKIDVVDASIWNGADISIYDMIGRKVYSGTYTNSSAFDVSGIGNGIYVINLNAKSGNSFQTKLVINK